jgi:hypothetical protein
MRSGHILNETSREKEKGGKFRFDSIVRWIFLFLTMKYQQKFDAITGIEKLFVFKKVLY